MSEPLYTWTPAQFRAHDVLVAHQQTATSGCHCGEFGNKPQDLGRSYVAHVLDELARAGLVLAEHQDAVTAVPPGPAAPDTRRPFADPPADGTCGTSFRSGSGRYYDCGRAPHTTGGHAISDPRPAAPDATAGDGLREAFGRWLFERDYGERGLATPDVATWDEYVEKNQEEWRREADAILAGPLRDVLAAAARDAELRKRVEVLAATARVMWDSTYPVSAVSLSDLLGALDGTA